MTVGAGITVSDGNLVVLGNAILSYVHDNIVFTPAAGGLLTKGPFIGPHSDRLGSLRIFPRFEIHVCFPLQVVVSHRGWGLVAETFPLRPSFCLWKDKGVIILASLVKMAQSNLLSVVFLPILEGILSCSTRK